ncbi:MAG TPA: RdgB/HAM1 family non-canonical purine NTP pyrophosphatase [Actinomycetota bacterium]|nr:RdgB/HAM1 family non-canonical purine NTP pyrophosphatase [Actinomycetota bacterium]
MSFPSPLAIASRNPGKLREILAICAGWPVSWLTAQTHEGPWPAVEEPHDTYLDNALAKARAVASALGVAALADDSGIEVDALGGGPGPRSARYAGEGATDRQNLDMLIRAVAGVPASGRTARYRCVAAVVWPDGREVWAEGHCEGTLLARPRGTGGFGYDPIFVPAGWDRTMAELAPEEKDRISHRGRALRALRDLLEREP